MNKKYKTQIIKSEFGDLRVIDTLNDGEGIRILKNFLYDFSLKMAELSLKHADIVGFPPFIYRERQLHTIIAPIFHELTEAFLMESPVIREWNSLNDEIYSDSHGWVDYWCLVKKYNYYIELKHGFISYKSKSLNQKTRIEWEKAHDQLNVIQNEIEIQKDYAKGIFRIALHILPIYYRDNKETIFYDENKSKFIQEKAFDEISATNKPNWSCLWQLNDNHNKIYSFGERKEKFPAVLILANISSIEKK